MSEVGLPILPAATNAQGQTPEGGGQNAGSAGKGGFLAALKATGLSPPVEEGADTADVLDSAHWGDAETPLLAAVEAPIPKPLLGHFAGEVQDGAALLKKSVSVFADGEAAALTAAGGDLRASSGVLAPPPAQGPAAQIDPRAALSGFTATTPQQGQEKPAVEAALPRSVSRMDTGPDMPRLPTAAPLLAAGQKAALPQTERMEPRLFARPSTVAPATVQTLANGAVMQSAPAMAKAIDATMLPRESLPADGLQVDAVEPEFTPRDVRSTGRDTALPDQVRFAPEMGRNVSRQIADAARLHPDRPFEVQLHPEELGRVRMVFSREDGALSLQIFAERGETLDLMRRNTDVLQQELRDAGYGDIDFAFADQFDTRPEQSEAPDDVAENAADSSPEAPIAPPIPQHIAYRLSLGTGLDIRL